MSVKYNDKNGVLRDISGLTPGGDLELGAVAQRSGTFTNTAAITQTQSVQTITFESSMPDADYCVDIGCGVSINWSIQNRTASGFTLALFAPAQYGTIVANAASFTYRAFKVYTLQYAEQNASDITTIKSYIPATTTSSNKLVNASELADVDLEDLSDVDVTSIADGQTLVWDDTNSKWVNGQGGKVYTEGLGIDIDANDKISVDQTYVPTTYTGTTAEWNALSAAEKAKYTLVSLTDDADYVGNIVDSVTDGNMSAVTSNAVYDYPIDSITDGEHRPPTSNAVYDVLEWKFVGTQTNTTPITLPSDFKELYIKVTLNMLNWVYNISKISLTAYTAYFMNGTGQNPDGTMTASVINVTTSKAEIFKVFSNTIDSTSSATITVYYR